MTSHMTVSGVDYSSPAPDGTIVLFAPKGAKSFDCGYCYASKPNYRLRKTLPLIYPGYKQSSSVTYKRVRKGPRKGQKVLIRKYITL